MILNPTTCVLALPAFSIWALSASVVAADLPPFGKLTDPDGDCKVTVDENDITLAVPATHHDLTYTDNYSKLNAPRVTQAVEADFEIGVLVDRIVPLAMHLRPEVRTASRVAAFCCGVQIKSLCDSRPRRFQMTTLSGSNDSKLASLSVTDSCRSPVSPLNLRLYELAAGWPSLIKSAKKVLRRRLYYQTFNCRRNYRRA